MPSACVVLALGIVEDILGEVVSGCSKLTTYYSLLSEDILSEYVRSSGVWQDAKECSGMHNGA